MRDEPEGGAVPGEDALDELYAAPLEQFVSTRDALVRRLRDGGDPEAAARVAKLRKPSVAAWAVNQVVRRHGKGIEELLRQGDRLRHTRSAGEFREASRARQEAVAELLEQTAAILDDSGHGDSASVRERITQTLLAASAERAVVERLKQGRLERELEPSDVWTLPELAEGAGKPAPDADAERRQKAKRRGIELAAKAAELEREAGRLEDVAKEADRTAERAHRVAERAAERAAEALRWAEEAKRGLADLQ
ncbi:MAG: hypothetical protein ACRDJ4_09040 [Actinomycetota bacterium]